MAAVAGLLFAALALPAIGGIGILTRNGANKFNSLTVKNLGQLPGRSEILDRHGKLIAYYYPDNIDRVPVSFQQISPVMREGIVAIEDARFYQHGALDFKGTVRALLNNLQHKPTQGGSTIAQQYVKNALILTARTKQEQRAAILDTPARKIRELRIAIRVEHELTKNQLLAAYLNAAYFGNHAIGVQLAAQRYFHTTASKLTLTQAALLAGLVENPSKYDPFQFPGNALSRRNEVLAKMAQQHYITPAEAQAASRAPLGLNPSFHALQSGCTSRSARRAAFFCDYVLAVMQHDPAYKEAWAQLNDTGGLKIYTTMSRQDQRAAQHAVSYMVPPPPSPFNPGGNAAAEVLIQPGTGKVRAIAVDRRYGVGRGQDNVNYAVDTRYNGGLGVQTGSSSKLFTLLTALEQGIPFGFSQKIVSPTVVGGFTNCHGDPAGNPPGSFPVTNAEGAGKGTFTLYNGTTQSINVFYAHLEQQVGLCNVVKTAVKLGLHRADGTSLRRFDRTGNGTFYPADDIPSFTLGSVNVSPMSMAAAYATVAARGRYCAPIAIGKIVTRSGGRLPVKSANCRQVISPLVADAATHILQGVLVSPGTAAGDQITQHGVIPPQAAKTGTANSFQFAAFGGYTPRLAGYVSMFYPSETRSMSGQASCYRSSTGGLTCPGEVFGMNAGQIWQFTFNHAWLGRSIANFVPVPLDSPFYSKGTGVSSPKPPKPHKPPKKGPGGGGGNGGGGGGDGHGGGGGGGGGGTGTGGPGANQIWLPGR
jgi:membrane peptidoglycan carboxypeptidase